MEPTNPSGDPVISVVLIVFDDEEHVGGAIRSVLEQSFRELELVVVDDASTDGTPQIVAELARRDPRVRVITLERNSGGCSVPRNAGLDAARGEWVMFCDSDDAFEPDACEVLLGAAKRHGVDIASGLVLRVDLEREREWLRFDWLYTEERRYDSLAERPELLFDVVVCNKIFRRRLIADHGLRFPLGLHYEDMDFATRALALAKGIAVVPQVVYRYVRVQRSDRASIVRRRGEVQNFADRLAVQRLSDEFLRDHGVDELKIAKDVKFLEHDLPLHLAELPAGDAPFQQAVIDLARGYLDEIDPRALERTDARHRVLAHMVRSGDLRETLRAVVFRQSGRITRPLAEDAGRRYWASKVPSTTKGRQALDVTDAAEQPEARRGHHSEIVAIWVRDATLRIRGRTLDQFGRVPPRVKNLQAELVAGDAHVLCTAKAKVRGRRAAWIEWVVRLPAAEVARAAPAHASQWQLTLTVPRRQRLVRSTPMALPRHAGVWLRYGRDGVRRRVLSSFVTDRGRLGFESGRQGVVKSLLPERVARRLG